MTTNSWRKVVNNGKSNFKLDFKILKGISDNDIEKYKIVNSLSQMRQKEQMILWLHFNINLNLNLAKLKIN